ncbi:MAG: glycosyltransferase family 2 protein [Pseudomonadota bacterium]
MSPNPAVSIVMPAYNAAGTIAASVRSVQAQTLKNWELIIVDDGSSDGTAKAALALAKEDKRICVVQRCNRGPSTARNAGVDLARGYVLAFLDSDDFWAGDRLSGMLKTFRDNPKAGVLFSRTRFLDAETLQPGTLTRHRNRLTAADLMAENALCSTSNIVCFKSVFVESGGFKVGLHHAEDQDWLLRIALEDRWEIRGVDEEWFFYRSAPNSQSADLEAMRAGWHRMVEAASDLFPEIAPRAARRAFGPIHRQLARRALRMGRTGDAIKYLFIALSRDPFMILRQPKRTGLTLIGTCLTLLPHSKFKELVAK